MNKQRALSIGIAALMWFVAAHANAVDRGSIALRGPNFFDLKWDPTQYPIPAGRTFLGWELHRSRTRENLTDPSTTILFGTGRETDFYRDEGLSPDTRYHYLLLVTTCADPCEEPQDNASWSDSADTGPFSGDLFRDLALGSGEHEFFDVEVFSGATLRVTGPSTTLRFGNPTQGTGVISAQTDLDVGPPARLEISGATIERMTISFGIYSDDSIGGSGFVRDTEFGQSASLQIYGRSKGIDVRGCEFRHDDVFTGQLIVGGPETEVSIRYLRGKVFVSVSGGASVTLRDGNFLGGISALGMGTTVEVRDNIIATRHADGSDFVALATYDRAELTATGNEISILPDDTLLLGAAKVRATDRARLVAERNTIMGRVSLQSDADVLFTDNIFERSRITVERGAAHGRIEFNTIVDGGGLRVDDEPNGGDPSSLTVRHNCIRNNNPGVWVPPTLASKWDLRDNYWGHSSGPYHETLNPGGRGDTIFNEQVLFDPWDRTDENCLDEPPPTPTPSVGFLFIETSPDEVIPDGETTVRVFGKLRDPDGGPVEGVELSFAHQDGLGAFVDGGTGSNTATCESGFDGQCDVTYRAPAPREVFPAGAAEGVESVTLTVRARGLEQSAELGMVYLEVVDAAPRHESRNNDWNGLIVSAETNYEILASSVLPRTFDLQTSAHDGALRCDYSGSGGSFPWCEVDWLSEDKRIGLQLTAELRGGPDGIRGKNGAFLRKAFVWKFATLSELEPRIVPVQISEDSRLLATREGVTRVHAGLTEETELDWVEAEVRIYYDNLRPRTRTLRFYPGEIGSNVEAKLIGNSANFYSQEEFGFGMPILGINRAGEHTIQAEVVIRDEGGTIRRTFRPAIVTAAVDLQHFKFTPTQITVYPIVPNILFPGESYPWKENEVVDEVAASALIRDGPSATIGLLPIGEESSIRIRKKTVKVFAQGVPMDDPRYIHQILRRNGYVYTANLNAAIFLVPGDWLAERNDGDPFFHQPRSLLSVKNCIISLHATGAGMPHCMGHVHGLEDRAGGELRGFDLFRNRYVDSEFPELGYTIPMMRRDVARDTTDLGNVWVSVDDYANLFSQFASPLMMTAGATASGAADPEWLVVGGEILDDGGLQAMIDTVEVIPTRPSAASPAGGDYRLQLEEADGTVLATHDFGPAFSPLPDGRPYASFLFTVEAPPGLARLRLFGGATQLAVVEASEHAPQVAVDQPMSGTHEGQIGISWTVSDADPQAELRTRVLYSVDGGASWEPLDLAASGTSLTLDSDDFANCDACRVRVVVNDGFHTVEADSEPFAVENPPAVSSVRPPEGASDVGLFTKVVAVFRDPMNAATIGNTTFTVRDPEGSTVNGAVTYHASSRTAVFSPTVRLEYGKSYTARLSGSIRDVFNQALGSDVQWSFTVERSPYVSTCTGDCNNDSSISIAELIRGVNIALGNIGLEVCSAFDRNGDGRIAINELIQAVGYALRGCPGQSPTKTRTPTPTTPHPTTPSRTPTRTATTTVHAPSRTPTRSATAFVPTHSATPTRTTAPVVRTYCDSLSAPLAIPDADGFGVFNDIVVGDTGTITDLDVVLDIEHTWVGDLFVMLSHLENGIDVVLIEHPGHPEAEFGCGGDDVDCTLDDEATKPCEDECAFPPAPALGGRLRPNGTLSNFDGAELAGVWSLTVADSQVNDFGALNSWCIEVKTTADR